MDHPRAQGQGIRIGVIDTGIDQASLVKTAETSTAITGALFLAGATLPQPYQGRQSAPHGTTVARILLRHAPAASLVSADVFGPSAHCAVETLLRAIEWCIGPAQCQVLNLSLGVTEDRLLPLPRRWQLQRLIEECYHRNVMVVAAAHNEHPALRSFPAVLGAPLIGVAKGPWHDQLEIRYNPLERVEFQATASSDLDLLSASAASSWAAPHVTALVARLLSLRPDLKPFEIKTLLCRLAHA
jgi:subtilisin